MTKTPCNFGIYSLVIFFNGHLRSLLKMYVEKHTKCQVYKNTKTHDVYHRCFCCVFDKLHSFRSIKSIHFLRGGGLIFLVLDNRKLLRETELTPVSL